MIVLRLLGLDQAVTVAVNGMAGRTAVADALMSALSHGGPYVLVAAVAVRWWWTSDAEKFHERYLAILCTASVAFGLFLNQLILLGVHRVRPYDAGVTHLMIERSGDYSFPSDHATVGFAIAFALLGVGAKRGWGFMAVAALVSLSRVYVGTHYVSDILGGLLSGLSAAIICSRLIAPHSKLVRILVRIL